jgi:hypothetical protein
VAAGKGGGVAKATPPKRATEAAIAVEGNAAPAEAKPVPGCGRAEAGPVARPNTGLSPFPLIFSQLHLIFPHLRFVRSPAALSMFCFCRPTGVVSSPGDAIGLANAGSAIGNPFPLQLLVQNGQQRLSQYSLLQELRGEWGGEAAIVDICAGHYHSAVLTANNEVKPSNGLHHVIGILPRNL